MSRKIKKAFKAVVGNKTETMRINEIVSPFTFFKPIYTIYEGC